MEGRKEAVAVAVAAAAAVAAAVEVAEAEGVGVVGGGARVEEELLPVCVLLAW